MTKITVNQNSTIDILTNTIISQFYPKELILSDTTGGLFAVKHNSIAWNIIKLLEHEHPISLNELYEYNLCNKNILNDIIIELFKHGIISIDNYIYSASEDELDEKYNMIHRNKTRSIHLCVFHIHNYCNLGCKYCYMANPPKKRRISLEVMKRTVQKIVDSQSKNITFEFHGGEPTMSMGLIKQFIEFLENNYVKYFDSISYSIQTNGYNISEKAIEFMSEKNFQIRISLDGDKINHDSYRITKKGQGTFEKIIDNIKIMNNYNIFPEVCCVIHKKNVHDIVYFFDQLSKLNISGIRFLPIFQVESMEDGQSLYMSGEEFANAMINVFKHALKNKKEGLLKTFILGEVNSVCKLTRPYMCLRHSCGAGNEMIGIDVNGDVYPCEEMIGDPYFKLFNIDEDYSLKDIHSNDIYKQVSNHKVINIDDCANCIWRNLCTGGCPKKSYNKYQNLNSKSDMCLYYKQIFKLLADVILKKEDIYGIYRK